MLWPGRWRRSSPTTQPTTSWWVKVKILQNYFRGRSSNLDLNLTQWLLAPVASINRAHRSLRIKEMTSSHKSKRQIKVTRELRWSPMLRPYWILPSTLTIIKTFTRKVENTSYLLLLRRNKDQNLQQVRFWTNTRERGLPPRSSLLKSKTIKWN